MPTQIEYLAQADASEASAATPNWVINLSVLWRSRAFLLRAAGISFAVSIAIVLLIPRMYTSQARIMPPESGNSNSSLLAALAGRTLGSDSLGGLAAALMGNHASGALFMDLLRSGTVTGKIVDRFNLRSEYGKRYKVDAVKVLLRRTSIAQDKKSGVLAIAVRDRSPARARDMAQAYLDELNAIVTRTSSSPAHQERIFLEHRLLAARDDLGRAQHALSDFSSTHGAIDLREQTRATVESQARVQGEIIATEAQLRSMQEIYGDQNVRVRGAQARIASLRRELAGLGGSSEPPTSSDDSAPALSYLPLRQVPRLAVPYADLLREVHIQETVFDLLTQQYEMSRIQEAKDIPSVNVIDPPGIPEKKSFPPRTLLIFAFTCAAFFLSCAHVLLRHHYAQLNPLDARRALANELSSDIGAAFRRAASFLRGAR
jgi:uncharacterized protein involved in exopolysaccharide biosynthesis